MKTLMERASHLLGLANNSVTELANIAGVKPPSVSDWLNGKTKTLKSAPAIKMAKHFKLNILWITEGIGPMSDQPGGEKNAEVVPSPKRPLKVIECPDLYTIPQYRSGGSMGNGLELPDQPGIIENWSVSREWLYKNVRNFTATGNLCIVTGFGPSMQPLFNPGDPLLVDIGIKSVVADGIYFFRVGSEGFVKQLQKIPTPTGVKYIAKSKNPDYDTFEISDGMDFEVLGRVIRVWCGTDF